MTGDMEGHSSDRVKALVPVPLAKLLRKKAFLADQSASEYIADVLKKAHPGWQEYKGGSAPPSNRDQNLADVAARNKARDTQRTGDRKDYIPTPEAKR